MSKNFKKINKIFLELKCLKRNGRQVTCYFLKNKDFYFNSWINRSDTNIIQQIMQQKVIFW